MPSMLPKSHWEQFGAWIRKMRRDADLTQKDVAKGAGIHEVHVARIEKGESGAKRETVIALAKAIGLDLATTLKKAGFAIPDDATEAAQHSELFFPTARKPTNLPELLAALEGLGIAVDWATIKGSFENYTPDDFEELKDQIAADAGVKIKRITNR